MNKCFRATGICILSIIFTHISAAQDGPIDLLKMYQEGERLVEIGQLERAHKIFFALLQEQPDNEDVNFAYGMVCFSEKKYSASKLSMERVISMNPDHTAARFTLGRILLIMGQDELAREQFKEVLKRKPSKVMKARTREYMGKIRTSKRTKPYRLRIDAGLLVDDNVNVGPESEAIDIAPLTIGSTIFNNLTVGEESLPDATYGVFLSMNGSGIYDVFGRDGWLMTASASYYQNWLADNAANESIFAQASAGFSKGTHRWFIEAPLIFSHITYGSEPLINMGALQPSLSLAIGDGGKWFSLTTCKAQIRDYEDINERDGTYLFIGEAIKKYSNSRKHRASMSFAVFQDLTDSAIYEHIGTEWNLSGHAQTASGTILYSTLKYTTTHYAEKDALAFEKREDTQAQLTIGFTRNITESWGIDANYQYTDNRSTFGLYQYERNMASFSTFYSF